MGKISSLRQPDDCIKSQTLQQLLSPKELSEAFRKKIIAANEPGNWFALVLQEFEKIYFDCMGNDL